MAREKKTRRQNLWDNFGITPEDYGKMEVKQGLGCAICGMTKKENGRHLSVDHDHKTGKIRGLLCNRCNSLLGYAKDSPKTLRNAAKYLEEPPTCKVSGSLSASRAGSVQVDVEISSKPEDFMDDIVLNLLARCGDPELAADIAQDAIEVALSDKEHWKSLDNQRNWILTVAKHKLISYYRRPKTLSIEELEEKGYTIIGPSPSPEERAIKNEETDSLRDALGQLSEKDQVVLMCVAYDIPHREIARQLNTTIGAVDTRICRAKKKLRLIIERQNGSD